MDKNNNKTCLNCMFRDNKICMFHSKEVEVIINEVKTIKFTTFAINKKWSCDYFEERGYPNSILN